MQIFYVNIGGGEPTIRRDFWHLISYAVDHGVGVKFSTNGVKITPDRARKLASTDYVDVQVSLDGATPEVNDRVRGPGSFKMAVRALDNLAEAGFNDAKVSVVVTRQNVEQLDELKKIADDHHATLRLTRLRPSGRAVDHWQDLRPTATQQRRLFEWLVQAGGSVLTGDSFFHLSAFGKALPGLNLCGAGRVVCLIDPVGDVYACPFAIHSAFRAGNVLTDGGFRAVWQESRVFAQLRSPHHAGPCSGCSSFDTCRGGCMAAKFFTGLALSDPDPDCVRGYGEKALQTSQRPIPKPDGDHSRPAGRHKVQLLQIGRMPRDGAPTTACNHDPLADLARA